MNTKYIFVTGGVVSGLGKGITAAALGRLLKNRGYNVVIQKFDQYINIDPGSMNPIEHGEVFVTDDGTETDLDLGHYERFIDENLSSRSSLTTGKIYSSVIEKERKGFYCGKTVQVIPHITNEVKENIYSFKKIDVDIVIVEIGGTVGDIEGLYLIEAIRQIGAEKAKEDIAYVHVTLLPYISGSNELKSKPTQHSVKELQSFGIKPDILVCRSDIEIPDDLKEKISLYCNVTPENVIQNKTVNCLYEVPLMLEEQGLANQICKKLNLNNNVDNSEWEEIVYKYNNTNNQINIGIVGKYAKLEDSYLSVIESIEHAAINNQTKVNIEIIDSNILIDENAQEKLSKFDGIIVPGGFGLTGVEGKITAIKYARENNIPFLGIGLGMQLSVIEFARNVLNIKNATSEEFDENAENKVLHIIGEGNMRLGAYNCLLKENSLANRIYGINEISERHRNRYEFNNTYLADFEQNGMIISGESVDGGLVEIIEIPENKYFIATQFHPEFKSRPNNPAPLFDKLIKICLNK